MEEFCLSLFGDAQENTREPSQSFTGAMILTSLGVVYGDIGTSPLYVFRAIGAATGGEFSEATALGSLSLIFWTLVIVVSLKYCWVVMNADNRGEGGILALMSLAKASWRSGSRYLIAFGLLGAALIYGDGVITPAISVLSAVEGLKEASSDFARFTMPIAAIILVALFLVQRVGTAAVGKMFGPIMLCWFILLAVLGVAGILENTHVIAAADPTYAVSFLAHQKFASFVVLGAIFLSTTGAEAMYADMGHVGRLPIRLTWFFIVFPALVLNYAGQTAIAIGAGASGSLFFKLAPAWALYPLVALATAATVIASQSIITGTYSLTRQAMQLGWLPGLSITQTSSEEYGQIYVPFVNWALMAATLSLTIIFGSSDKLAGAYGAAVSTTMLLTTALLYRVMSRTWHWPLWLSVIVFGGFILIDLAFFSANLLKIADGGWIPLVIGVVLFIIMTTWRAGIDTMHRMQDVDRVTVKHFIRQLREKKINRSPGKAVFLTRLRESISPLIADHVRQMGFLYEESIALTVHFVDRPRVDQNRRIRCKLLAPGFWHLTLRFGFVEVPNVVQTLRRAKSHCPFDTDNAIYFSERDHVVARRRKPRLRSWRRHLFSFLYRNSIHPADRFNIPPENFVQVGRQIEI
jgi:KUP system potassium uptake protein